MKLAISIILLRKLGISEITFGKKISEICVLDNTANKTDYISRMTTAVGCVVTMPIYENIEAINVDTYLCTIGNGYKVVVDGNGVVVR